jgi:ribonuclease-3
MPRKRPVLASPVTIPTPADPPSPPGVAADGEQDDAPERLAAALGLTFHDIDLLRLALTHRSVLHDWAAASGDATLPAAARQSNERLEFLGDAVLGFVVADLLYHRYPDAPEGVLTAKRVALVRAERLVRWARAIDLADYLSLGQGERVTEGARDRMLAGAFEAVVGALALDRGLREVRRFLRRFIDPDLPSLLDDLTDANPKGRLQELVQERFRHSPVYRVVNEVGPAHARTFTAEVLVDGETVGAGTGGSKPDSEQAAAAAALAALTAPPPAAAKPKRARKTPVPAPAADA